MNTDFQEEMETLVVGDPADHNTIDVYLRLCTAINHRSFPDCPPEAELSFVTGTGTYNIVGLSFNELRRLAKWINDVAKHYQRIKADA